MNRSTVRTERHWVGLKGFRKQKPSNPFRYDGFCLDKINNCRQQFLRIKQYKGRLSHRPLFYVGRILIPPSIIRMIIVPWIPYRAPIAAALAVPIVAPPTVVTAAMRVTYVIATVGGMIGSVFNNDRIACSRKSAVSHCCLIADEPSAVMAAPFRRERKLQQCLRPPECQVYYLL